ncbi:hypothetical protein [Nocardioides sp.]|uniref:hypothetical protein n=1 Tax=Nocardioides sp. TaxID=35761 RepID=UPI001A24037C|nr:hypothetical protein [Nocardioides sp.]MBJ7358264.1 hypothetical protein [Nocardioides sp.]
MTPSRRLLRSAILSALAVAGSTAVVLVALAVASGVTVRPGTMDSHDTEFIDGAVLQLSWLTAPVLGIAAFYSIRVALLGTVGVAVSQFWAMAETVDRYQESGEGDGLEAIGYLFAGGVTFLCLLLVLVCGLTGWARRTPQDQ